MTPERWHQIQEVLNQALAMPTNDRARYVAVVCADDHELQSDVDSLLAQVSGASDFLTTETATTREVVPSLSLIGQNLGPYSVVSRLGAGGMGQVYLAQDTRLNRLVAVKALHQDGAAGPQGRERLLREAQAVAALNDPYIAAIYDILDRTDDPSGPPYIVMEYVEGETLSDRLRRGPLPLEEALRLGREIALALATAHKNGVVHRDLKPANLRLTVGGHIKVLDFGLARILPAAASSDASTTVLSVESRPVHAVAGTPGYMSPEQTLGRSPKPPTDIFSLGVVLYQMIVGRRPFPGDDFLSAAVALMSTPTPSIRALVPDVPVAVDALIARMLAKEAYERPSAEEVADELERLARTDSSENLSVVRPRPWPIAASIGALVIAAVMVFFGVRYLRAPASQVRPTIAVLPLTNLSGDASKDYLGVGIAETLTTSLARVSSISVISRTNLSDAPRGADAGTIARNLGATMVLQGSVQQSGDRLRVSAKLLRPDGSVAWAGDVETSTSDLFTLESRLAASIIAGLPVNVSAVERTTALTPPTRNREALDSYWQGLTQFNHASNEPAYFDHAISSFQRAVSLDPEFSLAYAAMGNAYRSKSRATNDLSLLDQATSQVLEALRIDPAQAEVRLALASLYSQKGRNDEAVYELRRVLSDQPTNDDAHRLLGDILAAQGHSVEALAELEHAVDLRPQYWRNQQSLGVQLLRGGKLEAAVTTFTLLTQLKPDDPSPYQQLGAAYQMQGNKSLARKNYERSIALNPNASSYTNLGTILYAEGKYAEAAQRYEQAIRLSPKRALYRRNLGDAYLKLNRVADAKVAYEKAVELAIEALAVNPTDAVTLSQLGVYEAKLGRPLDADRHENEASKLSPVSADVLYRHAVVLALAGKADQALKQLSEAISRGYSKELVREDDDLASLRSLPAFQRLLAPAK